MRRTIQSAVGDADGRRATVITEPHGYRLEADPESVDALRFENALRGCLGATPDQDLQAEAARMEELKLVAIEELASRELRLVATPTFTAAGLLALTRRNPYRERLWLLHMEALRRCGRLSEAAARYREFRTMLVAEHGIRARPGDPRQGEGDSPAEQLTSHLTPHIVAAVRQRMG